MQKDQRGLEISFFRRRAFLGLAATAGISGGLGCLSVLSPAPEVTAATFRPHIGARFQVHGAKNGPLDVKLVEAHAHTYDPNRPEHVRHEPFSLIFRAAETQFEDQICKIYHPRLGTIEAFLSRVDIPKRGQNLQAVFG